MSESIHGIGTLLTAFLKYLYTIRRKLHEGIFCALLRARSPDLAGNDDRFAVAAEAAGQCSGLQTTRAETVP